MISHELSERLIKKYGKEEKYFEISYLSPDHDKIFFQLNSKNVSENLNLGGISVLDYVVRSSGIPLIRQEVEIKQVNSKKDLELRIVELSLPEVHISPRDLWYYERSLIGKILYSGVFPRISCEINQYLPISITGMGNESEENSMSKRIILSGLVTDDTTFIIKPRSVRIIMILMISREFFCFSSNGFPWWRGVISFFKEYLNSNKQLIEHHFITILLTWKTKKEGKSVDYYKVFWEGVLSQITLSQTSVGKFVDKLRWVLISFQKNHELVKSLVSYYESNVLESINFALTQLQNDLIDGSLVWTGRNIKVLSSGPPIIISDLQNYQRLLNLSEITEVRFLKTSITCNFISFSELNWYYGLNIYHKETFKVINLKLPMTISYYKIENTFYNDYNDRINLSSTITLLDEYVDDFEDLAQEEEDEYNKSDIDLILNGEDMVVRNLSGLVNNKREKFEYFISDSDNTSPREFSTSNKLNSRSDTQLNHSFGTFLLPLTTTSLSKIDIENSVSNSKDLVISEIQRISNWTLTPRRELFLAYIWKNYRLNNQRLTKNDIEELSLYMDKSEYKDINIEILRLIYYDLIVHRMSMSFQISTFKSKNIVSHYNSENIQMLKCYNNLSKNITPNYDYIHQLNLLKDDSNILVEVIDAIVQNNGHECNNNSNMNKSEEYDSSVLVPFYTFQPKKILNSPEILVNPMKIKSEIINYKYEYFLYRYDDINNCSSIDVISEDLIGGKYIKYYTIFNNLSNVNFSTVDEILVWQREIPIINELINESYNELLNYNFDKNNLDYYYLLTSYISGLSISYIHFAFIPYVKISDSSTSISYCNNKMKLEKNPLEEVLHLDCYSNYYKNCCLESILNNWIKVNSVNSCQLKEMVDHNVGKIDDECLNMKNLKKISEVNIKNLIKSLQSFFFKNAPKGFNRSFDIEIMDDHNYFKNERKSVKVLYSWCESFEYIKEEYETELRERYREINFTSNNNYNNSTDDNFEPISWFVIYFDSIWHPMLPFKFSIGWLTCPSIVISRIIRKLKPILLKYYFTLIQLRSSDVYSSYEVSPKSPILSSYTPLNPPYIIKFSTTISNEMIKSLLKSFISSPLSLQLVSFDHSNSVSRFFLAEPHSIYTLELNPNALLLRANYYQYFWKNNFQYDSFPIFKCPCSSSMFDHHWRNHIFHSHFKHIKKIIKNMQI